LKTVPGVVTSSVFGPDQAKAEAFAALHGIGRATVSLREALAGIDAAIVCSPSDLHAAQTAQVLDAGVPALVEFPACATSGEAAELAHAAASRGLVLQCAHTSRYLPGYAMVREALRSGSAGVIEQVTYIRHFRGRQRSWTDDALVHHAGHALDLLLDWFGAVEAVAAVARPRIAGARNVSLLARLPHGAPASVSISYDAGVPCAEMILVGTRHGIRTDGFSRLQSDLPGLEYQGDGEQSYEAAIREQDAAFLQACGGSSSGIPWSATISLVELTEKFQRLERD
jgi:2-hydroxy-4-carboxymuconate semialdehyde hemiacetal dehydrogenase